MSKLVEASRYCVSVFDGTHDTPKPVSNGKLLITSKHISGGKLDVSTAYFISEYDYISIQKRSAVSQWDILFSMIGSVGEVYLEKNEEIPYAIKNMGVFSCKDEYRAKWLYYYLQSPAAHSHINRYLNGAVQKFLPLGALRSFPVIPFDNEKIKLVKVLEALDAKIDCNNRINAELEAMAKTLYDYWFVQFDFPFDFTRNKPDPAGKPYRSSGGKMVYNPTLKREIPLGWEVVSLKDFVELVKGNVSPSDINANTPYIGLEHIGRKTIVLSGWANAGSANSDKTAFRKNDILFGKIRPYFHKVTVGPFDGITSTDTIILRPKRRFFLGIAFETIFSEVFVETATRSSTGSKMPRADWNVLQHYKVPVPDAALLESFHSIFEKSLEKIHLSTTENHHITQLRDWLLPMLMNGQVTVQ